MITLVSLNVGRAEALPVGQNVVRSGILKTAVPHAELRRGGFVGDEQGDRKNHGGPDQAVYLYRTEDYAWWSAQLGRELTLGTFGENLSVSGLPEEVSIGDQLSFGAVRLEVTAPRIPCGKLAAKLGEVAFVKTFVRAERPGFYARVLAPGRVGVGDPGRYLPNPEAAPSVQEVFRLFYDKQPQAEALRRTLAAPIAVRTRRDFEKRLERLTQERTS